MVLFLIYCWNYRTLIAHLSVIGHSMKIIINQNKNNNIGLLLLQDQMSRSDKALERGQSRRPDD